MADEHVRWEDGQPLFPRASSTFVWPWPDDAACQAHYRRRRMRLSQLPASNLQSLALAATDRVIATLDLDLTALD